MFAQLPRNSELRRWALMSSTAAHVVALLLLVRQPAPVFLQPEAIAFGAGGSSATPLYLPYDYKQHAVPSTESRVSLRSTKSRAPAPTTKSKRQVIAEKDRTGDLVQAARAGSVYGSLAEGPAVGREIRPALPIVFRTPEISRSDIPAGVQGDVVVEVTIDSLGNIVQTRILQRIGYGIDEKVVAALQGWRFTPATQDGVPIPSQHDIHFHFPN